MQLKAKDFASRADHDAEIEKKFKRTTENKLKHKIVGTRGELARLQLSEASSVWGIGVVCTDTVSERHENYQKPNRGEMFDFGINLDKPRKRKKKNG